MNIGPNEFLPVLLIVAVICGAIGNAVGSHKGLGGAGFWLGFLLGPIGVLIVAVMQPGPNASRAQALSAGLRKCPYCAEMIQPEAVVCRYCGRDVTPVISAMGPGACACGQVNPPDAKRCRRCHRLLAT